MSRLAQVNGNSSFRSEEGRRVSGTPPPAPPPRRHGGRTWQAQLASRGKVFSNIRREKHRQEAEEQDGEKKRRQQRHQPARGPQLRGGFVKNIGEARGVSKGITSVHPGEFATCLVRWDSLPYQLTNWLR
ncbi:hypothetical protein CB1_001430002 [Camelus ferus]|nr:hypothetical protein CB1_001430002 [Camelus ferus]